MTCFQTKITTYPALPIADISPLEKLILSKVLDCAEIDGGLELYTDTGPINPIVVSRHELLEAMDMPDQANESLLKRFVRERVLSILPVENPDPESVVFIDLSEFPWQFVVQDIITRSPAARELVVIQWVSDPSQRPDTFGASVSLVTENGIFHATSEDLLADFRKRDQALTSGAWNGEDSVHQPHTDAAVVHAGETMAHLDRMQSILAQWGWPPITICRKRTLPGTGYDDLYGNCIANQTLPSLAFGMRSCSIKWKQKPQDQAIKGCKSGPNASAPHPIWMGSAATRRTHRQGDRI